MGLFIGRVLATYLSQLTFARVSNSIVRDIRLDIFQNLQRLGMSFYDQTAAGSIVSRVTNDTQAVADMFSTVFSSLVSSFLLFLVTLVTMFRLGLAFDHLDPAFSSHHLVFHPVSIAS